jgi:hypothetical protein
MARERIGLGREIVLIAFTTFFDAFMLGMALAFGLGGRDLARQLLERRFLQERKKKTRGFRISDELGPSGRWECKPGSTTVKSTFRR